MNRRIFLQNFILVGSGLAITNSLVSNTSGLKEDLTYLKSNSFYIVKPNDKIAFPLFPKKGDFVYIKVESDSVTTNPKIIYVFDKILGEKDNLLLDSLCILKFEFHNKQLGWIVS